MMFLSSVISIFLLVSFSAAARIPRAGHVVHEKRDFFPAPWSRTKRLAKDHILPMRFGLKQNNIDRLEEMLMDVSHPDSPNYGKHWSAAMVAETFAPARETIEAVKNWLEEFGIHASRMRLSPSKGWIDFNATVEEVEELLDTEYHVFTHEETGKEHICKITLRILERPVDCSTHNASACDMYSVPSHIREHIDLITPTLHFDAALAPIKGQRVKRDQVDGAARNVGQPGVGFGPKTTGKISNIISQLETCDQIITPDCLRALYEVVYKPVATEKNSYGIG